MKLELKRREKSTNGKATIGELFVDGVRHSFTLEDTVREVDGQPVSQWKVPKETAIPSGEYGIAWTRSARFSLRETQGQGKPVDVYTLQVLGVQGFDGIRIHPGNTDLHTEGCILLGETHNKGEDFVGNSTVAVRALEAKVLPVLSGGDVWLKITNEFDTDFFGSGS